MTGSHPDPRAFARERPLTPKEVAERPPLSELMAHAFAVPVPDHDERVLGEFLFWRHARRR